MVSDDLLALLVCPMGKAPLRREGDIAGLHPMRPPLRHPRRHPQHADRGGGAPPRSRLADRPRMRQVRARSSSTSPDSIRIEAESSRAGRWPGLFRRPIILRARGDGTPFRGRNSPANSPSSHDELCYHSRRPRMFPSHFQCPQQAGSFDPRPPDDVPGATSRAGVHGLEFIGGGWLDTFDRGAGGSKKTPIAAKEPRTWPARAWGRRPTDFLWAVGIENTFVPHTRAGHRRLDEYELMDHYRLWRQDLDLAADLGISTIRYGIPWYRVNPRPGVVRLVVDRRGPRIPRRGQGPDADRRPDALRDARSGWTTISSTRRTPAGWPSTPRRSPSVTRSLVRFYTPAERAGGDGRLLRPRRALAPLPLGRRRLRQGPAVAGSRGCTGRPRRCARAAPDTVLVHVEDVGLERRLDPTWPARGRCAGAPAPAAGPGLRPGRRRATRSTTGSWSTARPSPSCIDLAGPAAAMGRARRQLLSRGRAAACPPPQRPGRHRSRLRRRRAWPTSCGSSTTATASP